MLMIADDDDAIVTSDSSTRQKRSRQCAANPARGAKFTVSASSTLVSQISVGHVQPLDRDREAAFGGSKRTGEAARICPSSL
jgi:hypothetical protein